MWFLLEFTQTRKRFFPRTHSYSNPFFYSSEPKKESIKLVPYIMTVLDFIVFKILSNFFCISSVFSRLWSLHSTRNNTYLHVNRIVFNLKFHTRYGCPHSLRNAWIVYLRYCYGFHHKYKFNGLIKTNIRNYVVFTSLEENIDNRVFPRQYVITEER